MAAAACAAKTARMPSLARILVCSMVLLPIGIAAASPTRVDQQIRAALQLEANATRGAGLYSANCASCHGPQALGDANNVLPALAGQRQAYLIKQLADFTELERDSSDMHRVASRTAVANPQAWADLAGYLSELPAARFPETGDGGGVELGEAIFQEQCASCHEDDARGDDDGFVPSLRDQHYGYLVRTLRGIGASHRLNVDADLVRFLDSFDTDEITAVADYLSRLRGPTRDRATLNDDGTLRN
jgi:cytochrome c553